MIAQEYTMIQDPRPDLKDDSDLWARLLNLAKGNHELLCYLNGMRCLGTIIKRNSKGAYLLRPMIGDDCWPSEEAYNADKERFLRPFVEEITQLMRDLSDEPKERAA